MSDNRPGSPHLSADLSPDPAPLDLTDGFRCKVCARPYLSVATSCFLCSTLNSVHPARLTSAEVQRASAPRLRVVIAPAAPRAPDPDLPDLPLDEEGNPIEEPSSGSDDFDPAEFGEAPDAFGIDDISETEVSHIASGVALFDETLSGGLVLGKNFFLSGGPGVGKSSLLLQVLCGMCRHDTVLYATGEQEVKEIAQYARRFDMISPLIVKHLKICRIVTIEEFFAACRKYNPIVAVCDSVQAIGTEQVPDGQAGKPRVMSAISVAAMDFAKTMDTAFLYIGHARKDGSAAGLNDVQHYMDVLMEMKRVGKNKTDGRRVLSVLKSRVGAEASSSWVMTDHGLESAALVEAQERKSLRDKPGLSLAEGPRARAPKARGLR